MATDYDAIYDLIREVLAGEAASYGMIASLIPGVGPRQVARAMRYAPDDIAWYRIVTASGAPADHAGAVRQREMLRKEGVRFRKNGAVDWNINRWKGPSQGWIDRTGSSYEKVMEIVSGWA